MQIFRCNVDARLSITTRDNNGAATRKRFKAMNTKGYVAFLFMPESEASGSNLKRTMAPVTKFNTVNMTMAINGFSK